MQPPSKSTRHKAPSQLGIDRRALNVRALLEASGTPFAVADYAPRAAIFRQGDASDSVILVERGRILLAVTTSYGKEAICGLVETGAFLGEEAVCEHAVRRQTAIAMTATQVLVIGKEQMVRLLRTQPPIADRFIAHILARHTRLEADLIDQLLLSSEQRLARMLLVLAGCDRRHQARARLPDVSQETLAQMVGTTRSRVNVFLGKFKKLGFIEQDRGALTVNPAFRPIPGNGYRGNPIRASATRPQALTSKESQWLRAG